MKGIAMATKQDDAAHQLSLDDILETLDKEPGKLHNLPLTSDDIGAGLLDILSKGLYTNPLDCLREYVQNGVDAGAHQITIKMTGNSVIIFDDGVGMDPKALAQARQFGLSNKSLAKYVGFRGIGIYSGFGLCRKLHITSTRAGDPHSYVLVFDFAAMRRDLEASRRTDARRPSLLELLSKHIFLKQELDTYPKDRHFTNVELVGISEVHIKHLSNRSELKRYLLQNLPVDFADGFEHRALITEMLKQHVDGYKAVRILLQSDGLDDETVLKEAIRGLQAPYYGPITTSDGRQIAYFWACLTNDRSRIWSTERREKKLVGDTNPEGFVYKIKGFTIGDRDKLRPVFKKAQLYRWYTGEIYILDPDVIPNAERDDFETNNAKKALELAVRVKLEELEGYAGKFQAISVADERIEKYTEQIGRIAKQVDSNTQVDDLQTFSDLNEILKDLERQKSKASVDKRPQAKELITRAKHLQKQLREYIDKPKPQATRNKRAAGNDSREGSTVVRETQPPPPPPATPKTLRNILQDGGWELEDETLRLVELMQESLEDVLAVDSSTYRSLMDDLESRVTTASADE
jgi:molecular chaperone HtpG